MKKIWLTMMLLFVIMSITTVKTDAAKFTDVPEGHSLQVEIEYLVEQKVISGYRDRTFKPNEKILKKHVAVMVVKALNLPTTNVKNPGYKDVPVTHPYYKEIAAAYTAGLFDKSTNFKPNSTISRAFMAQILTRAYNLNVLHTHNDFVDVKKSSPFYTAIHAVASNSIAKGSRDKQYNLRFNPNSVLTRGHFAAFLARAMTLNTEEYIANTNYHYYYSYSDGAETISYYDYYEHFDTYLWYEDELNTYEQYSMTDYSIMDKKTWVYGVPESGTGIFVPYPFTIGMKIAFTYDIDMPDMQQKVLDTDAIITINDQTFEHVIIIEEMYYTVEDNYELQFMYDRFYLAPDYGLIKSEGGPIGEEPNWHRTLTHRKPAF